MIEEFNYLLRMIALGASLMLLAQVVANDVRRELKWPIIGLVIGLTGYLVNSTPLDAPEGPLDPWIDLVSLSVPFFLWLFARHLFERPPQQRLVLCVAPLLLFGWFIGNFLTWTQPVGFFLLHLGSLGLIADLVRVAWIGRDDDLVEQRRPIRLWLPLLLAAQTANILIYEIAEILFDIDSRLPAAQLINLVIIIVLIILAGLVFLRTDQELLVQTQEDLPDEDLIPELDLNPSEKVLHEKLTAAMNEGAYRTPGLTIAGLSDELDTPEHRLRALINQRLGHRNFSAFLNRYRIAEAKGRLSSAEHVDLPILTIAMDMGYNSLPPFNRAFRNETGISPSEYRKAAFAGDPQEPEQIGTDQN